MKKWLFYFLCFVIFLSLSNMAYSSDEKQDVLSLNGEWEFYWNKLLEPDDFRKQDLQPSYINVPSTWKDVTLDGEKLSSIGYGTYKTTFHIPKEKVDTQQALSLYYIGSAYKIWIDGSEYSGLGVVGKTKEEEIPRLQRNIIFFEPDQEYIEIVIQVSNFSFREGGMMSEVIYGESSLLIRSILVDTFLTLLVIGAFFIFGIYHLIIFKVRRKETAFLYIGLFSLGMSIRMLTVTEFVVHMLFPIISWEMIVKAEYLIEVSLAIILPLLLRQVFLKDVNVLIFRINNVIALVVFFTCLFTPTSIFTNLFPWYGMILLILLLYLVIDIAIKARMRQREDATLNFVSALILIVGLIYETLNYAFMFSTVFIFKYAIVTFIFIQAVIISNRYERINKKNENLMEELERINSSLEEKIARRTKDLREKNEQLKESQQIRARVLTNIAHDMGTPIVGVQLYLQILKEGKVKISTEEILEQLFEKLHYIQLLNNDLLELSKLESKKLLFQKEEMMFRTFFVDVFETLKIDLEIKDITIRLGKFKTMLNGKEVYVQIDPFRFMQVMQNIINNAVKFNHSEQKIITLNCFTTTNDSKDQINVEIEDNGLGISPEDLPHIFDPFFRNEEGIGEGNGLGLAIVKEIIEQQNGHVGVREKQGGGIAFYFTLPVSFDC